MHRCGKANDRDIFGKQNAKDSEFDRTHDVAKSDGRAHRGEYEGPIAGPALSARRHARESFPRSLSSCPSARCFFTLTKRSSLSATTNLRELVCEQFVAPLSTAGGHGRSQRARTQPRTHMWRLLSSAVSTHPPTPLPARVFEPHVLPELHRLHKPRQPSFDLYRSSAGFE